MGIKARAEYTLVKPGTTREKIRQASIDLFRKIQGREPTQAELQDLEIEIEKLKSPEIVVADSQLF